MMKKENFKHSEIGETYTRSKVPNYYFWGSILNSELLVFCFVRAYCESDFQLYEGYYSELIPYFFALSHISYA